MHLVGRVGGDMLQVGQHAQQDVVVMGRRIVDDLAMHRLHALVDLLDNGIDGVLDGSHSQVRDHRAVRVALQILKGQLVAELVDSLAEVQDGAVALLLRPGRTRIVLVYGVFQGGGGAVGQVEAGVGHSRQHGGGIAVGRLLLQGQLHHLGLGLASREDDGHGVFLETDGVQSDGDDWTEERYLNATQVAGGGRLRLEVGGRQARGAVEVAAPHVEGDVAVRTETAEEEADAAHLLDFLLILAAPLVNQEDGTLLENLFRCLGLAITQGQIYLVVWKHFFKAQSVSQGDIVTVDEDAFRGIQPKALHIEFLHIVVEAVVLFRTDGVELVNLHKMKT